MASEVAFSSRPLGALVENYDAHRVPVKKHDRLPGRYPYYGASGIVDWVADWLFEGEYLLVAEDGDNLRTRKTPVAFLADGCFWVNNHAHVLCATEEANNRYLMYAINQLDLSGYLTGSTRPKLTQGTLNQLAVPAPPRPTQDAIAEVLGALDDKIELNDRLARTADAVCEAAYRRMTERANESGWWSSPIAEAVTIQGGSTPSTKEPAYWEGGAHRWATPKDLSGQELPVLLDTSRHITDAGVAKISSGLLPAGTVLLSSRAPVGYTAIAEHPTAVNQGFIAMTCDRGLPNLYVLRWARDNVDAFRQRAGGTTFQEISKRIFRSFEIPLPPAEELDWFMRVTEPLHAAMTSRLRENATLAQLRDALLPRLVSGKLRISDTERLVGEAA